MSESTDPEANINDADLNLFYHEFGAKNHLSQLRSHSEFIVKSYRRLKGFFPSLTEEDILEHDRSKLSFTEMAGYTDKWVWGLDSEAWKKGKLSCRIYHYLQNKKANLLFVNTEGLDHHYLNNPHHPQHHLTGNGDRMDMPVKRENKRKMWLLKKRLKQ